MKYRAICIGLVLAVPTYFAVQGLYGTPKHSVYSITVVKDNVGGAPKRVKVGRLVKAAWANIGSWIYIYDPEIKHGHESMILQISFHHDYEDMGSGGPMSYVINLLIEAINSRYKDYDALREFIDDGRTLIMFFQSGSVIEWKYIERREPIFTTGRNAPLAARS